LGALVPFDLSTTLDFAALGPPSVTREGTQRARRFLPVWMTAKPSGKGYGKAPGWRPGSLVVAWVVIRLGCCELTIAKMPKPAS